MTNTTVFETGKPENPLFTKLRRRFSYDGDHTVAEYMIAQVLKNDGDIKGRCPTAEYHLLHANNLPRASTTGAVRHPRTDKKAVASRTSLLLFTVCVIMLIGIIFISINNYRLNMHVENLESQLASQKAPADVLPCNAENVSPLLCLPDAAIPADFAGAEA